ncbi:hypothetical protein B4100_2296 [Heyndrickxia coagulans]|nr:hypothetical protein B4100_2296 [Heyndrickxia coagulans]
MKRFYIKVVDWQIFQCLTPPNDCYTFYKREKYNQEILN